MKIFPAICLSLLLWINHASAAPDETFRTDINPALIYYQAFLLAPNSSDGSRDYLFTNNWQGQHLTEQFGSLISGYDTEMKYLHQAAAQTFPCDWGIDLSPGPQTLLPELAWCKKAAIAARLHAMWELQQGDEEAACRDLLGALALGRNSSRDGTLIAVLVQIAIENIVCATVAENFGHFSPASLQKFEDGFNTAPARGTVASSMAVERFFGGHWLRGQVEELQNEHPGDDAAVMKEVQRLVFNVGSEGETNYWQNLTNAAGDTVDGLLKMTLQSELFAEHLSHIVTLPHGEFEERFKQYSDDVKKSGNFLTADSLNAWPGSRRREFTVQAELAMMRAAIEYKLHGDAGLKNVQDPFGIGPFTCERFVFQSADRGFALKSAYAPLTVPVTMIFVEKDGPPFLVNGNHAGQPAPK
jgi:hypothetical protein